MSTSRKINKIYFLAICGTAMASLAAMLKKKGYDIYGSDENLYPPMSTFLEEQQISVFKGFDPAHLEPAPDLVIVGNVISRGNVEIEEILDRHLPYMSLPEALRDFMICGNRSIVVTGTHGKTTTTSLVSWIFDYAGKNPGFMIGGIPLNFGRGYQVGGGGDFILEGDEYDSAFFDKAAKFLRYMPDIGIINNIEFDHADIYKSLDDIKLAFRRFVNLIPRNGLLVVCRDNEAAMEVSGKAFCPVVTFGESPQADWRAEQVVVTATGSEFLVIRRGEKLGRAILPLAGGHNIRNALAAMAVAEHAGIKMEVILTALREFRGIKRRLEFVGEACGVEIFDDFGHHPTAIKETLAAFRARFPRERIFALYEPRSATTRRNIFQKEFVGVFQDADYILVPPVNRPDKAPAGELFSCAQLAADLVQSGKQAAHLPDTAAMVAYLVEYLQPGDKVITFSNGPFDNIHNKLMDALRTKNS